MTHSPTLRRLTSPMRTEGKPVASIFTTATSVRLSAPTMRALNSRLSGSVTSTWSAPSTTWALVMMKPSGVRMKPEPTPRGRSSSGWGRLGRCWRWPLGGVGMGTPKKRRNSSCISSSGPSPPLPGRVALRSMVRMLTTEGPTCSTKSVKSGRVRFCACAALPDVLSVNTLRHRVKAITPDCRGFQNFMRLTPSLRQSRHAAIYSATQIRPGCGVGLPRQPHPLPASRPGPTRCSLN